MHLPPQIGDLLTQPEHLLGELGRQRRELQGRDHRGPEAEVRRKARRAKVRMVIERKKARKAARQASQQEADLEKAIADAEQDPRVKAVYLGHGEEAQHG